MLYECSRCGTEDNSACGGNYSIARSNERLLGPDYRNGELLCFSCMPFYWADGSRIKRKWRGEEKLLWHDIFPKEPRRKVGT